MELIVDLHTHSHYSRATSRDSTLEGLYKWGKIKGISIIGTGDFTHPSWYLELQEKLEPAEPGLFRLKEKYALEVDASLPQSIQGQAIRFILTVEISNIYSKYGKVRKLHNLIVAPTLEVVSAVGERLSHIGNLKADGRPILGLDSKELLKICLETDPNILFIPAHIWTPYFALFGSNSGFDSIQEAFEELSLEIKAIETGLSSDPFMNWRLDQLQKVAIISNSDAHSPSKLGREATVIDSKLDYFDIVQGIKTNDQRVVGTIEFFPQEGKYHYDGHRDHHVRFSPQETKQHQGICPVCHKPVTVGVDHRVDDLANHPTDYKPPNDKLVEYIIPLVEIIAEVKGTGVSSKPVLGLYEKVYSILGNEFNILRRLSIDAIKKAGFDDLSFAIDKMRKGQVVIEPGYDGVYGTIKIFQDKEERKKLSGQMSLL
ncbi:MAG: UvrD/REP helicase family protein [Candidatus Daviesbacteria bacterium GW2011_GWA1_41_61]|uniref:UvrD/REP helicase family protein n=1 Tax=Candidatus Daviesbacteria bacterium GW2011_GWA2_40_9 TaxID=1618424 RepID=A0A0G0U367_9BACT|nr:MAG: UvrD/REP helicase family protein [Candidatus Daviesbacteria bacterium GW2011_GWC1_40_9]KKR83544.1 MAG: UvrD/REP helicase family protein [Candidatus Daviesbacteria bacterium GW2011_GWA2_40_9]KKR93113.1 MAG: UvrD/REP helicase family protein [Candidatus Daviesbacteria bacterium GW2011_GWB1_41_15]KKS15657.1 MAG: UvrD/REP helicase family protein [Candidatus Daviesbacteria bacterium GW2011_GWA1_41_61]